MKYIKDYLIFFFVGLIVIGYLVGKRQEDKENIVNEAIQPYQEQIQELQEENSFLADEVEEYKSKIEELEQNLRDMEDEINAPTYYTNDADKTVYISSSGIMHKINNCSGMKEYEVMSYADAIEDGYSMCENCGALPFGTSCSGTHDPESYSTDTILVFTCNNRTFHVDQDCSKFDFNGNDDVMSIEDAIRSGYTPCEKCCK